MAYKVVDIYQSLPRTNCGDCGRGSCFAFASAVYLEAFPLESCPHLAPEQLAQMQERVERERAEGDGRKPASSEQALQALRKIMASADLSTQAELCGGDLSADSEVVSLRFLDTVYRVTRDDVVAVAPAHPGPGDTDTSCAAAVGGDPTVWVKIFLFIYLTRANGRTPADEWVAYRELPNAVSKSKSFEECGARIAAQFEGDPAGLDQAVAALGGEPHRFGSAERCYRFQVLPRVPMLLLFWDREEEFPARVSLLLDRQVLDYLDQEAIVFMAEAFASRVLGGDLDGVAA